MSIEWRLTRNCIWILCALAVSRPTTAQEQSFWPFQVGNTWKVQTPVNGKVTTQIITVTKVTPGKGSSVATVEAHSDSKLLQRETYRFDAREIARLTSGPNGESKIYPGLPIIEYPLVAHKTWYWNGTITTKGVAAQAAAKMTATGPESVKLQAGTFQAYKVHMDLVVVSGRRKITIPNDFWFASGVGLIRQEATIGKVTIESKLIEYKVQPTPSHP